MPSSDSSDDGIVVVQEDEPPRQDPQKLFRGSGRSGFFHAFGEQLWQVPDSRSGCF